jgi:hypothetical protein
LHVLKNKAEVTADPIRMPDGTRDYVIRAEYVYGLSRKPPTIEFGKPDYDTAVSSGAGSNPDTAVSSGAGSNPYSFTFEEVYSSIHTMV